ncbi:MAG: ABC transporter substrate-binding protein [Rhodococcus sp.]|uniref:ABC transporter substrate-binding protein n=1 Tax=Rhodococcus TaxID=1827 RepID=UPI00169EC3FD|nr:ABC transporter substrate-binding protein [Rhodococcus sp. (in: high G+C Gram-positive bacteria)]NLV80199.1 ABC transporter substrate-binding protein [Rhodococcus sp. (in: high G+C Gram-positive bacteria)]
MKLTRLTASLIAVPLLFTAACSGSSDSDTSADSASPENTSVTVEDQFGEVTVEGTPERVVTLSVSDNDAALAVGVVPVAMAQSVVKPVMPWTEAAIDDLGGEVPPLLDFTTDVPVEEIASYDPDLILATGLAVDAGLHEQLAAIAPTLTAASTDSEDSWSQQAQRVADLFGARDEIDARIDAVQSNLEAAAQEHPELQGATYVVSLLHSPDQAGLLTGPDSATAQLLAGLGLVPSEPTEQYVAAGNDSQLSPENFNLLEADVLVGYFPNAALADAYAAMPVFTSLNVVQGGHHYLPTDEEWRAFRSTSLLSMTWLGEQLPEKIAAAVRGEA